MRLNVIFGVWQVDSLGPAAKQGSPSSNLARESG
jgi:hypothetical protein